MATTRNNSYEADVETLVASWGLWSRRYADRLGMPTSSPLCQMIEQARRFARRETSKKLSIRAARQSGDARKIAEALGNAERQLTAAGNQTRVMTARSIGFVDPEIMKVDKIIAGMANICQMAISRRYRYLQPDRIAAKELRVSRDTYSGWVEAGLDFVAQRLDAVD